MLSQFLSQAVTGQARVGLLGQLGWVLLGLIVVAFLLFGFRDVLRLSWARISAISSVSFDESIRRRVLWITPLAIVGAIAVSQLQNAVDPQDAIRQTTKICLFAAGLVVVLTAIILASTNLQKEIETRVIYTIVTKPTTRLEIVLGKVWGFAKVSAAILLIMGVFTYAYLHVRAWRLGKVVTGTLQTLSPTDPSFATLKYYEGAGLLNAKAMTQAQWMQMLARPPVEGEPRWMAGALGQQFTLAFNLSEDDVNQLVDDVNKAGGVLALVIEMPTIVHEPTDAQWETIKQSNIPVVGGPPGGTPAPSSTAPSTAPAATQPTGRPTPVITVSIRNRAGEHVAAEKELNKGSPIELQNGRVVLPLVKEVLEKMLYEGGAFTVTVVATSPAVEYAVGQTPVSLQVVDAQGKGGHRVNPLPQEGGPYIVGSIGRFGQQIYGGAEGEGGLAVYRFPALRPGEGGDELTFEAKVGIERAGERADEMELLPEVQLRVRDPKTGKTSDPVSFRPETNRICYVNVPRAAFPTDGPFDVLVRSITPNKWLGLQPQSFSLATGSRSFALNLFKSLLILWLMSVLVITIALFCSTFVSWPIAVVLTLVLLFGHWGVNQIGDAGGPGIGATVTGQTTDPIQAKVMRTGVNFLAKVLMVVSAFLPDVSSFQATADIERGVSVPLSRLGSAGWVLLGYGVPMVMLAYLVLKRKEVAP
jgi:ABC-type transport system involved in multi-copper enzyme maturation permease subunit